jgi:multiple sugar transport system substrate-binding protein
VVIVDGPSADAIRKLAPSFTAETGIKVSLVQFDYDSSHQKMLLSIQGKAAAYDVIQFDQPFFGAFANGGVLEPLDSRVKGSAAYDWSDIPPAIQQYGQLNGTTYGLDLSSEPYVIAYRPDLLQKASVSVPTTWDEYVAAAQKIRALGPNTYGHSTGVKPARDAWFWIQTLWSYGGDLWDSNYHPTVTSAAAKQAAQLQKTLLQYGPASTISNGGDATAALFGNNDIGLSIQYAGYYSTLTDPTKSKNASKTAFAPVPAGTTMATELQGWLIGIPSDSTKKDAGWQFIEWLLGKANVAKLVEAGAPAPGRTSLLQDPGLSAKYPIFPAILAGAQSGRTFSTIPEYPAIQDAIATRMGEILSGQSSIDAGLTALDQDMTKILKDAGLYK